MYSQKPYTSASFQHNVSSVSDVMSNFNLFKTALHMIRGRWFFFMLILLASFSLNAQKIVYSEVEKGEGAGLDYEIVGKVNGNILIYKSYHNNNWISIMDNDMKQIGRVDQAYLPENDKVVNVDFFNYGDFVYVIYQYRKRNIIHCAAAKINGEGKLMQDLIELDTTQVSFGADSKIYSVVSSEDKSRIMIFKVNSRNKRNYLITTILLDDKLSMLKKSRLGMEMEDRDDYLDEFHLDNEGDMVFTKFDRINNENLGTVQFIVKYAQADSFSFNNLNPGDKIYFDELHIKPDNYNKRYLLTSFYYSQRRGNVEGYYFYIWDKATQRVVVQDTLVFHEELRREARGNASTKGAFNDYFIRNIVTRKDGGFLIASEAFYTTSRGGAYNRFNYLGNPYSYYPQSDYYWYGLRSGQSIFNRNYNDFGNTRYQADNIVVSSFNRDGQREWNSVIAKEQYDDSGGDMISYEVMNTGGQIHFLFNNMEKRLQLLSDFSLDPSGKINRNPTLKNLDRGYDFLPKFAKQISARQVIIPCRYRSYTCFAKLEFN